MQMALSPVKLGNHQVPSVTESEAHSPAPEADPTLHPASLSDNLTIGNRGDRGKFDDSKNQQSAKSRALVLFTQTRGLVSSMTFSKTEESCSIAFKPQERARGASIP